MRASSATATPQERRERTKNTNTVASRMKQVVDKLIDSQRGRDAPEDLLRGARLTMFLYRSQQAEITNAFFVEMQKENPSFFVGDGGTMAPSGQKEKEGFMGFVASCYDEFVVSCANGLSDIAAFMPPHAPDETRVDDVSHTPAACSRQIPAAP